MQNDYLYLACMVSSYPVWLTHMPDYKDGPHLPT